MYVSKISCHMYQLYQPIKKYKFYINCMRNILQNKYLKRKLLNNVEINFVNHIYYLHFMIWLENSIKLFELTISALLFFMLTAKSNFNPAWLRLKQIMYTRQGPMLRFFFKLMCFSFRFISPTSSKVPANVRNWSLEYKRCPKSIWIYIRVQQSHLNSMLACSKKSSENFSPYLHKFL